MLISDWLIVSSTGLEVSVEGVLEQVVLEARMIKTGEAEFRKSEDVINGDDNWRVEVSTGDLGLVQVVEDSSSVKIDLSHLTPGSVAVVKVSPHQSHTQALQVVNNLDLRSLEAAVSCLSLQDLQHVLYQCSEEAGGCYNIPGLGDLHYAGLAGLVPVLQHVRSNNDLGHPLAANLRSGDWLLEFMVRRLESLTAAAQLSAWIRHVFSHIKSLPRYLIPRYFDTCVMHVYQTCVTHGHSLMSPFISSGSDLVKLLSLGSIIHTATCASAPLPPLSSSLSPPATSPTLAAGSD